MHALQVSDLLAMGAKLRVSIEMRAAAHAQAIGKAVRDAGYVMRELDTTAQH
ncbi:MAG: hypothetical protein ABL996_25070 [Micropepsaceae bacterium]